MVENKTKPTNVDPAELVASVDHLTRRADAAVLLELFSRVTASPPKMWVPRSSVSGDTTIAATPVARATTDWPVLIDRRVKAASSVAPHDDFFADRR